ncbi:MAG: hypothetical protein HOE90_02290 [Bacteriovoracaceae bacterium]|jgi:hypothetical protein|nr:hypothetical protein [Bacteriovoracaceae bacterium]
MKLILITLCLGIFTQSSHAKLGKKVSIRDYIEAGKTKLLGPKSRLIESLFYNKKYACTERVDHVNGMRLLAMDQVEEALREISVYEKKPKVKKSRSLRRRLRRIARRYRCILRKLPVALIHCQTKRCQRKKISASSKTPTFPHISLCNRLFKKGDYKQAAILVHELSHTCGTLDFEYDDKPRKHYGIFGVIANAESFEYWIKKGFCLPGLDCPDPKEEYQIKELWDNLLH